jgi:hypothetical protein
MTDGAIVALGDLTAQGDELTELLGREVAGSTGAGLVLEPGGDVLRGLRVGRHGVKPAVTPEASGIEMDVEIPGNLGIVETLGTSQDDPGASHQLLGSGGTANQRLQRLAFSGRHGKRRRFGTTGWGHPGPPFLRLFVMTLSPLPCKYPRPISAELY